MPNGASGERGRHANFQWRPLGPRRFDSCALLLFKVFASLTEAENYRNPDDLHTSWYVVTQDSLLSRSYTVGRDDLWSQKLEVDKVTGAIAVLGEH